MKHETLYCRQSGNMSHWSKFLFAGAVLFLSNFSTFLNFARYWGLKRVPPHIKKPQWTGRYHKERLKYAMLFRLRFQLKFLGTSWKMFLWSDAAQEYIHKVLKYPNKKWTKYCAKKNKTEQKIRVNSTHMPLYASAGALFAQNFFFGAKSSQNIYAATVSRRIYAY